MKKDLTTTFWLNNLKILYKNNNYLNFFPTNDMTKIEQFNAVTRFCIYYIFVLIIFNKNGNYLYPPIIVIFIIIFIYYIYYNNYDLKKREYDKDINSRYESRNQQDCSNKSSLNDNDNIIEPFQNNNKQPDKQQIILETSSYDSDNNLISNKKKIENPPQQQPPTHEPPTPEQKQPIHTLDEYMEYVRGTCRKPTINNPFMNPSVTEYNNGEIPVACNSDDNDIKDEMVKTFNTNLFRNVDDAFEVENSQLQFYTIPSKTIPNNQKEFAEWLYKIPTCCKDNNYACTQYEDLRFKR